MAKALEGKIAIITGAGRGIGQAFALRYADEGARLLIPDISLERAEATAVKIRASGGKAIAMLADISKEEDTKAIADRAVKEFGGADILVNNAAVYWGLEHQNWDSWTVEDWNHILGVNVTGTWLCCKAIAPLMVKQKKGKIINIASNVARVFGAHGLMPYAVSKGAVYTLTHTLARALGPSNINVNAIAPGYTASEASVAHKDHAETSKGSLSMQALRRQEEPSDLAGTAVFLASPASDFITGQVLFVDGGNVIG
jgi:3-oxoacyl-[acyl-carrier protein] reductase